MQRLSSCRAQGRRSRTSCPPVTGITCCQRRLAHTTAVCGRSSRATGTTPSRTVSSRAWGIEEGEKVLRHELHCGPEVPIGRTQGSRNTELQTCRSWHHKLSERARTRSRISCEERARHSHGCEAKLKKNEGSEVKEIEGLQLKEIEGSFQQNPKFLTSDADLSERPDKRESSRTSTLGGTPKERR